MSGSTDIKSGGLVSQVIKVEGTLIPDTCQVYSVRVNKALNRISAATVIILDGSASKEAFVISSSDTFVPGKAITIEAGYDAKNTLVFKGIITKQSLRVDDDIGSALEIECKDEAVKMTIGRKSASFAKSSDSDAITKIIGNYSGLQADVSSTSVTLPLLQQYYATDWDFMLTRAEVNSLLVKTINGKVSVFSPTADTSTVLTITYGDNLYSFNADLNSLTQLSEVKASAWDYKNQKLLTAQASNNLAGPGNLSSKKLSEVVGLEDFELQTSAALGSDNLSNWAKGQMLKSELSKITGEVLFQGSSLVEPGVYITIAGMGKRFDGDHLVASVCHDISEGNWLTEVGFGLAADWFAQEPDVVAPVAAGLLPGAQGLHNATVKKIFDDPDSEYRILVDLPLFDPQGEGLQARLTNFYSTSGAGVFFLPEVGDEVIVGFLNDDPRYPIILGSMYSNKIKPYSALDPNEKNSLKAIVTKSELRLVFDDENKVITLTTPADNKLVLDDKNKKISLMDENKNSIVMSSDGITLSSPKSITLKADKNIEIKGTTGIKVEASGGDVETTGMNIKETADTQYSAKGNATASVQGGTELTLKAAMVMIN
ncbi:MAG: type VI secretion system tip protein VgrG [Gammaproteobacteria bacterium]|nr:type VI secretion system tip protein VgrG [Gammaproteobacteria bacterium]